MKLSQFAGSSAGPIGSTIEVPVDINTNQLTQGAATYLRAGVLIPYVSPTHDQVTSLGFKQNKWLAASNNSQTIPPVSSDNLYSGTNFLPNKTGRMFAMGVWGILLQTNVPGLWTFTGIQNNTGQGAPVMISEPPIINKSFVDRPPRSAPFWNSALNVWLIFEILDYNPNGQFSNIIFWSSTDGVNWQQSNPFEITSSAGNIFITNTYIADLKCACVGQTAIVYFTNQAGTQFCSGFDISNNLRDVIINSRIVTSLIPVGLTFLQFIQVTGDDVIVTAAYVPDTTSVSVARLISKNLPTPSLIFTNTNSTNTLTSEILTDRNSTHVVIVDMNYGSTYRIPIVNNVLSLSTIGSANGVLNSSSNWGAASAVSQIRLGYTGAYWVLVYIHNSAQCVLATSLDSATFTARVSISGTTVRFGWDVGFVTKDHITAWDAGASIYRIMALAASNIANSLSTTLDNRNNTSFQSPVEFNGLSFGINGNTIKSWGADGIESLVYYSTTTDKIGVSSENYLKIVNGKLFVVGATTSGTLVHTSDGVTWTAVTLPAGIGAGVNDIEFYNNRYLVAGITGIAYSSDLVTWAAFNTTEMPVASYKQLLKASTYILALSPSGIRRSTDGNSWAAPTGNPTMSAGVSGVFDGTSCHVFTKASNITFNKYTTTDGNIYNGTTINAITGSSNSADLPAYFINFNGKFYCKGSTSLTTQSASYVFTTTDFVNYTLVSSLIPMIGVTQSSRLFIKNNTLRYRVRSSYSYQVNTELVLDATTGATLIGLDNPIKRNDGLATFLRIS